MGVRIMTRGFSEARVRASAFRILRGTALCSMATVSRGRRAHINTAYFCCSDDLELYFLSDVRSRHCRNLTSNPSVAVTVCRSTQRWDGPDEGLQLFGACRQARGSLAARAERLYAARFPAYARWMASAGGDAARRAARLRSYRFFRFVPRRLKILDERVFGEATFVVASVRRPRGSR